MEIFVLIMRLGAIDEFIKHFALKFAEIDKCQIVTLRQFDTLSELCRNWIDSFTGPLDNELSLLASIVGIVKAIHKQDR